MDQQKEQLKELEENFLREERGSEESKHISHELRTLKIELGLITPEEIQEKRIAATKIKLNLAKDDKKILIQTVSERLKKRAIARLGNALRLCRTEPVNEVIKGEDALWKLPCKEYHGKCWFGHARVNWLIETSNTTQPVEEHQGGDANRIQS